MPCGPLGQAGGFGSEVGAGNRPVEELFLQSLDTRPPVRDMGQRRSESQGNLTFR